MGGKKSSAEKRRRGPYRNSGQVARLDPAIPILKQIGNLGIVHPTVMRFVAKAAVGLQITYGNLLDIFLVAISATAGVQLFDAVKIRKIEIQAFSNAGVTTAQVSYTGRALGATGDMALHSDTSMGMRPAYVRAVPSKKCTASDFQPYTTNVAFSIVCPIASVIDLHLNFRNALDGSVVQAAAQALVGAQPGNIYVRAFDGAPIASSVFTPLGTVDIQ